MKELRANYKGTTKCLRSACEVSTKCLRLRRGYEGATKELWRNYEASAQKLQVTAKQLHVTTMDLRRTYRTKELQSN